MERKEKQMKLLESKGGFAVSFSKEGQRFCWNFEAGEIVQNIFFF
jgi:hypothetical protein